MPWNPDRYEQFKQERSAPFDDLLALVRRRPDLQVIDLGCGTGELTGRLAAALPGSEVVGLDNSPEMLRRAESEAGPGLSFELNAIEDITGEWDLIFSHAALQWVDDHHRLIPHLRSHLRPGGQLAVQVPSNYRHPVQRLVGEVAREEPFRTMLNGWTRQSPVLSIDTYAEILFERGGSDITVYEKVYPHVLKDADAVVEWTRGTMLVPYMERLPESGQETFLNRYQAAVRRLYPRSPVFYAFQRILFASTFDRPADEDTA